jgi:predicted small lipoprotein YifL
MAERREMWMGTRKALAAPLVLAVLALGLAACGSGGQENTAPPPPSVSAATADHLAKLSDRIASDLDDGLTCDAAHAADDLSAAVEDADLAATLRPGVEEVATRLVNEVNCPPPPPPPEPEKKKHEKGDEHKGGGLKPPGHGGEPPGQAKLGGEG